MVIYNNDVSWDELQRVLDEGCFDSGAFAGRVKAWRFLCCGNQLTLCRRRSRDIPGTGHARASGGHRYVRAVGKCDSPT